MQALGGRGPSEIAMLLAGTPKDQVRLDGLAEPWSDLADAVFASNGGSPMAAFEEALAGRPNADDIRRAVFAVDPVAREASDVDSDGNDAASPSTPPTSTSWELGAQAWPNALGDAAYHGLIGRLVRAIQPFSEADPAAIMLHTLTGLGVLVGPGVRAMAGDAPHPAKLFGIVVGESSISRKGSSHRPVERTLALADPDFIGTRMLEGLSSGEGLIYQVRDEVIRQEKVGKGAAAGYQDVVTDPGEPDKRLWVVESEFATLLRVAGREGNTLTSVVRRAWDRDDLRSMTKNSPIQAAGAHISIVGHVTRDELLRYLDRTELANGFINRFLVVAARRARVLPDGESVPSAVLESFTAEIRAICAWASEPRCLTRDDEATTLWREVYEGLSDGRPGMLGAATNRAAAQVLRLSVNYAVVDMSDVITAPHLLAALEYWRYAEQSARWVFGDAIGDPTADTILNALRRNDELDREDIVNLFGRHVNRSRLDRALGDLLKAGLARSSRDASTGGRPREVWRAT